MIGFTAMAGAIGAGGLGGLAWQEGYQRGNLTVTFVTPLRISFSSIDTCRFFISKTDMHYTPKFSFVLTHFRLIENEAQ